MSDIERQLASLRGIETRLGTIRVHAGLDLTILRGEILALIGGSGAGKSTLLRLLGLLLDPVAGDRTLFGQSVPRGRDVPPAIRRRVGFMFQSGALISSLTVGENLRLAAGDLALPNADMRDLLAFKLSLSGLSPDVMSSYPGTLSGGMMKRAAVARALMTDPELLLLDEPTAGLDPVKAAELDDLFLMLRDTLGVSLVVVTHDLDTLWRICDRAAILEQGRVSACDTLPALLTQSTPFIDAYFRGPRGARFLEDA